MRFARTITVLSAAAAGSAFLVAGGATAAQPESATGGGQVEIGSRGGAGDTIAFTAKDTGGETVPNSGQVQYVDRAEDSQTVFHGDVTCVTIEGTTAEISGVWQNQPGAFTVFVQDNGEGSKASNPDIVTVTPDLASPECGDEFEGEGDVALARGNAQVRSNP